MTTGRSRSHGRRVGIGLLALAACSAGGDNRSKSGIDVRDSAGVRIVTVSASAVESLDVLTADSASLRVGADEGIPDGIIGRVGDAVLVATGGVLVTDRMTDRIVHYDATGRFVRVLARSGDGPGEFRTIEGIALEGDSVRAYDLSRQVLTSIPLRAGQAREQASPRATIPTMIRDVSRPRDGRVLWVGHEVPGRQGLPDDYYTEILLEDSTHTTVVLVDGQESREIGRYAGTPAAFVSLPDARVDSLTALGGEEVYIRAVVPMPFGRGAEADLLNSGLVIARPRQAEVRILDDAGAPETIVRFPFAGSAQGATSEDLMRWASGGVPVNYVHLVRRAGERFGMPDPLPFFSVVRAGADDGIWLHVGAGAGGQWTVGWTTWLRLARSGEPLVRVRVPSSVRLLELHEDRFVGVERDRLDVESVVVLPFREGSEQ